MQKTTLAKAYEAGLQPFDIVNASVGIKRNLGDIAAQLLGNRNPYFDKVNRDRFGTRVHNLEVFCSRLVLGAVESAQPLQSGERRFRSVLFACDGHVIHQTTADRIFDQNAAMVELQYEASKLSDFDMLSNIILRHLKGLHKQVEKAERVYAEIQKQGP